MAKFCGKCGSRLDEATGLCPKCDAEKIKELVEKSTELPKKIEKKPETSQPKDVPLSKKEARAKRKADKKALKKERKAKKKAAKKEYWKKLSFGQKVRILFLRLLSWMIMLAFLVGVGSGVAVYLGFVEIPIIESVFEIIGIIPIGTDNHESAVEDESAITKAYLQGVAYEIIELDKDNGIATLEVSVPNLTQFLPQIVTNVLVVNEEASYEELLQIVQSEVVKGLADERIEKTTTIVDLPVEEINGEYKPVYGEQWEEIVFGSLEDMYIECYRTMIGGIRDEMPE